MGPESRRRRGGLVKWKNGFLKKNISRDIKMTRSYMKTFKTFVTETIAKKNTLEGAGLKFVGILGAKVWPIGTSKNFENGVIWGRRE